MFTVRRFIRSAVARRHFSDSVKKEESASKNESSSSSSTNEKIIMGGTIIGGVTGFIGITKYMYDDNTFSEYNDNVRSVAIPAFITSFTTFVGAVIGNYVAHNWKLYLPLSIIGIIPAYTIKFLQNKEKKRK